MSKRNRYRRWAAEMHPLHAMFVPFESDEDNEGDEGKYFVFRSRRARRAQARLDGLNWRDMSFEERMTQ